MGKGFKIAICNLKQVWKSQIATSKHKYHLIAIFKYMPVRIYMPLSRLMTHNTLFISVNICKLVH